SPFPVVPCSRDYLRGDFWATTGEPARSPRPRTSLRPIPLPCAPSPPRTPRRRQDTRQGGVVEAGRLDLAAKALLRLAAARQSGHEAAGEEAALEQGLDL